uniref:HMG box domain-containing protein n=1 Tax=Anopheles farauti TaxID=69004 RepID=A0A182Q967_9DIPT
MCRFSKNISLMALKPPKIRSRSLSVALERLSTNDNISKELDVSVNAYRTESNEEAYHYLGGTSVIWTNDDYNQLTAKLRAIIPPKDNKHYKTSLAAIDWEQVAFDNRSAKEVREVAVNLLHKARKIRTLTEMLEDISKVAAKLIPLPKKPLTAYNFFVKRKYAIFKEKYPGSHANVLKKLGEEFAALSEKKKIKYEKKAAESMKTFKTELENFYREYGLTSHKNSKKRDRPEVITPFKMFMHEKRINGIETSSLHLMVMWASLNRKQQYKYIQQCLQQQSANKTPKLTKEEQLIVEYENGKPEPVPCTVYEFYFKKYLSMQDAMQETRSTPKLRRKKAFVEYKKLPKVRKLKLELEYQHAKVDFVKKYQDYISSLTNEDMRRKEIQVLQSIITTRMHMNLHRNSSNQKFSPNAESTAYDSSSSTSDLDVPSAAASPTSRPDAYSKPLKSIIKSTSSRPIIQPLSKRKREELARSPSHSSPKKLKVEFRTNSNSQIASPISNDKGKMLLEPIRPPRTIELYYKQYHYLGKPDKYMESFQKLSSVRKKAIEVEMNRALKKYFRNMQKFLNQIPPEKLEFYVNKMKQAECNHNGNDEISDEETEVEKQTAKTLIWSDESDCEDEVVAGDAEKANADTRSKKFPTNHVSSCSDFGDMSSE